MAIFTSEEDRRLPLLSQVAQMLTGEEDAFLHNFYKGRLGFPENLMDMPLVEAEIRELREIRDLSRLILEQIADRGKVRAIELYRLYDKELQYRRRIRAVGPQDADGYIPIGQIELRVSLGEEQYDRTHEVLSRIIMDLQSLCLSPVCRARRCDVCHNPFQIQRDTGENRFCSNRCSSRQRKRRQRVLKFPAQSLDIAVT